MDHEYYRPLGEGGIGSSDGTKKKEKNQYRYENTDLHYHLNIDTARVLLTGKSLQELMEKNTGVIPKIQQSGSNGRIS